MTREEARKAAEVMMAYADGKDIEYKLKGNMDWMTFRGDDNERQLYFDFTTSEYCIKKEPTYHSFYDDEECIKEMKNHQPFGLLKDRIHYFNVLRIETEGIWYINFDGELTFYVFSTNHKQEEIMFADGTPFGVLEE